MDSSALERQLREASMAHVWPTSSPNIDCAPDVSATEPERDPGMSEGNELRDFHNSFSIVNWNDVKTRGPPSYNSYYPNNWETRRKLFGESASDEEFMRIIGGRPVGYANVEGNSQATAVAAAIDADKA